MSKMKIYEFPNEWNKDYPSEYVWLEMDYPAYCYEHDEYDTNLENYVVQTNRAVYDRIRFKRRHEMKVIIEVNSLEELQDRLEKDFRNRDWYEIGYRDGIMMIDPWSD